MSPPALLCAVADDGHAGGLVDFAAEFADAAGFDLLVAHVADGRAPLPAQLGATLDSSLLPHELTTAEHSATTKGRRLLRSLGVDDDDAIVALGDPVQQILRLGRELDAALVVVSTRGRGPLRGVLLGTVSRTLARRGDRPIMVTHPDAAGHRGAGPVICGVAGTAADALPVVRVAADLAARLSVPLTPAHALDLDPVDPEADRPFAALLDSDGWAALQNIHHILDELGNSHDTRVVLRSGTPADELIALANETHAAAIVVGCQRHGALHALLDSSVSLTLPPRAPPGRHRPTARGRATNRSEPDHE